MAQASTELVGDIFKLGYRRQTYWGRSIALAFFSAEVGAGTFLVSLYYEFVVGMIVGLLLTGVVKPYYHLAHMGVPLQSWRAALRVDRSWVSRGAVGIVFLVGFGVIHLLQMKFVPDLPAHVATAIKVIAALSGLMVISYQGLAMAATEAFALWATPFVPLASVAYGATTGVLTTLTFALATGALDAAQRTELTRLAAILVVVDYAVLMGIFLHARSKSQGGVFSVALLTRGTLAVPFRNLVVLLGLVLPLVLTVLALVLTTEPNVHLVMVGLAWICVLIGFMAFRLLIFRAAVFEPITHNVAGRFGLPG